MERDKRGRDPKTGKMISTEQEDSLTPNPEPSEDQFNRWRRSFLLMSKGGSNNSQVIRPRAFGQHLPVKIVDNSEPDPDESGPNDAA